MAGANDSPAQPRVSRMNDQDVLEILRESSRPLRSQQIAARLRQRGISMPRTAVNSALLRLQQQDLARPVRGNRWVANIEVSAPSRSMTLDEHPASVLRDQVAERGLELARDRRLCAALLRDLLPEDEYRAHVHLLIAAFEAGVPRDLMEAMAESSPTPEVILRGRLAQRLVEDQALSRPLADWVVAAWQTAIQAGTG
jgi:hypothetical protein